MSRLIIKLTIDTGDNGEDDGYDSVHPELIIEDLKHGNLMDYVVDYEVEKKNDRLLQRTRSVCSSVVARADNSGSHPKCGIFCF